MADAKFERTLQEGLLDRLIDSDPLTRSEPATTRAEAVRRYKLAVKRDLEWLLNTVRTPLDIPERAQEVRRSLLFYGLPDISSVSLQNQGDEQRLLRSLEEVISAFEPRLSRVRVTNRETFTAARQTIKFQIEALLMMDPAPERIAFDTVLEIGKGAYSVKEA